VAAISLIGRRVIRLDEVTSTNDVAKEHALLGEAEGLVVVARRQTLGRGRRGQVWSSPPDLGLYFSALLRPAWPAADAAWLGVLAGLGAWQAVRALGAERAAIKWPNDVLLDGRKLAGVLVEPRIAAGRVEFAVLGIGVNVAHEARDWPAALRESAISLCQAGVATNPEQVTISLCRALSDLYAVAQASGVMALTGAWREATGGRELPVLT
jgi:BirA family transcriptional regulator, biotin operon repressor / biotin---[acetyl-CoA-carboxylase] ligase